MGVPRGGGGPAGVPSPRVLWPAWVLAVVGHQHVGVGRLGGDEEGVLWHVLLPDPSVYGSFQMKRKILLRKLL